MRMVAYLLSDFVILAAVLVIIVSSNILAPTTSHVSRASRWLVLTLLLMIPLAMFVSDIFFH